MMTILTKANANFYFSSIVTNRVVLLSFNSRLNHSTTKGHSSDFEPFLYHHCRSQHRVSHQQIQKRLHSSVSSTASIQRGDKLRVAVVGGGCAGLTTALHLAPLVEEGYIASPIDIYDGNSTQSGRDIGIGLWTTALDPFGFSPRDSHQAVYKDFTQTKISTWVDHVGYRTPDGKWLMLSKLPPNWVEHMGRNFPGLLFMRERDLLYTLQKAVLWEQQLGTLKLHRSPSSTVVGVARDEWWSQGQMQHPWSGKLELQLSPTTTEQTERDYHLIVAADGTWSNLRSKYGLREGSFASSSTLPGSNMVGGPSMDDSVVPSRSASWSEASHQKAVGLQDRKYTVFRGNAPITANTLNELDPDARYDEYHRVNFQTWGTEKSMRFASVPLLCPPASPGEAAGTSGAKNYQQHQVWFITINDDKIIQEPNAQKRVDMLLEHFKDWHPPINDIVRATDPDTILMERAIAHRHCAGPVVNLNQILQKLDQQEAAAEAAATSSSFASLTAAGKQQSISNSERSNRPDLPYAGGPGPAIVFMGDSYMTVDPILAQGFTVAMEGSANLHDCLRRVLLSPAMVPPPPLSFDPYGECVSNNKDTFFLALMIRF